MITWVFWVVWVVWFGITKRSHHGFLQDVNHV
jgi:hypothetical protein